LLCELETAKLKKALQNKAFGELIQKKLIHSSLIFALEMRYASFAGGIVL
jgi:hypothetical protein